MSEIKVITEYGDGLISQHVDVDSEYGNPWDRKVKDIIDTKEAHIKQALVAMGWTPPNGETPHGSKQEDMQQDKQPVFDSTTFSKRLFAVVSAVFDYEELFLDKFFGSEAIELEEFYMAGARCRVVYQSDNLRSISEVTATVDTQEVLAWYEKVACE